MTQLTIELDDVVEQRASRVLANLNISKKEAVTQLFDYIATHKQMPVTTEKPNLHLTDLLLQMPNVGDDEDFARVQDNTAPKVFD